MIERVCLSIMSQGQYRKVTTRSLGPEIDHSYEPSRAAWRPLSLTHVSTYWRVLHLLFVDDEPALRSLMAERLGERGYEVTEADSGEKAIELLEQFAFDVVIADLRMPGIDGIRVIE